MSAVALLRFNGRFQLKFWAQTWISLKFSIVLSSNESIGPVQKKKILNFGKKNSIYISTEFSKTDERGLHHLNDVVHTQFIYQNDPQVSLPWPFDKSFKKIFYGAIEQNEKKTEKMQFLEQ